jgi:AraC-like DNA-binding protein
MYSPSYLPEAVTTLPAAVVETHERDAARDVHVLDFRYAKRRRLARSATLRITSNRIKEVSRATYETCARGTCDGAPRVRLSTCLAVRERTLVDAGAIECVRTVHRDTLAQVAIDLASGATDGVLVSAAFVGREDVPALRALVHGFPSRTIVGLIGEAESNRAVLASLLFGQAGIRSVADVRTPQGWREFRSMLDCSNQPDEFIRHSIGLILREIGQDYNNPSDDRNEFFRLVFSPRLTSAKELAAQLGVHPSTLMSRFYRAGLPAPKKYVAFARLVWAAHLGESPAMSFAAIANRINASSPQSFHRTVRTLLSMKAGEFRSTYSGAQMLDCFVSRLVRPYCDTLRTFDPLADWIPRRALKERPHGTSKVGTEAREGRAA